MHKIIHFLSLLSWFKCKESLSPDTFCLSIFFFTKICNCHDCFVDSYYTCISDFTIHACCSWLSVTLRRESRAIRNTIALLMAGEHKSNWLRTATLELTIPHHEPWAPLSAALRLWLILLDEDTRRSLCVGANAREIKSADNKSQSVFVVPLLTARRFFLRDDLKSFLGQERISIR